MTRPSPSEAPGGPQGPRLAYRLDELAALLGVSRRSIERARARGAFPRPDVRLGRVVLWRPETIQRWVENGGRA